MAIVRDCARAGRGLFLLIMTAGPVVLLIGANVAGYYPMAERLILFLLAPVALALCEGVQYLIARFPTPAALTPRYVIAGLLLAAACGALAYRRCGVFVEDARGAVAYLRGVVSPADIVYLHGTAAEQVKFYRTLEDWQHELVLGDTGWPCCPKGGHRIVADTPGDATAALDFAQKTQTTFPHTVWLIAMARPYSMSAPTDRDYIRWSLPQQLCRVVESREFRNIAVDRIACAGAGAARAGAASHHP